MRISSVLIPPAHLAAALLNRAKVPASSIVAFSFSVIFLTVFSFYFIVSSLSTGTLQLAMIAGAFLTGFMDEVIRSLSGMRKMPTIPLLLARHSDLLLLLGILYIAMAQPYTLMTDPFIDNVFYQAAGALLIVGVIGVDLMTRKAERTPPGIETRAERMSIFTIFLLLGVYFDMFLLFVFAGIAAVAASLYLWIFWTRFKGFFDALEAVYVAVSRAWRRILPRGLRPRVPRARIPSISTEEKEEGYGDYEIEEHEPGSGYNFAAVVNDRSSEPVSNVKVTLLNEETGETYTGETDPSGRSNFVGTSEGQYTITLEAEGFKEARFERYISMDSGGLRVKEAVF